MNIFPPPDARKPFYREVPPDAPWPRYWKLLSFMPQMGVELQYEMTGLFGDLDVDLEVELKREVTELAMELVAADHELPDEGLVFQRTAHQRPTELRVKIAPSPGPPEPYSSIRKN